MQTIINIYNRVDHATYGLAELLVVGGGFTVLALSLYGVLGAVFYGYLQLFSLATGAF
jgi:hypothetical protein